MSLRKQLALPFAAFTVLAIVLAASTSRATTGTELDVQALVRQSDLVVLGEVERLAVAPTGPGGLPGIHTRASVRIDEVLLGSPRSSVEVHVHGGRYGDEARVVPGQANFAVGEQVVLFLFESHGAYWLSGMERGKWRRDLLSGGIVPDAVGPSLVPSSTDAPSARGRLVRSVDALRSITRAVRRERSGGRR